MFAFDLLLLHTVLKNNIDSNYRNRITYLQFCIGFMLNVFISYSHNEKDRPLLDELIKHLSPMQQVENRMIKTWDDSHIKAGSEWDSEIIENLQRSDVVLLLVSADFNNSRYIQEVELKNAIEREKKGTCKVIPIWLRKCDFEGMPYAKLEILPKEPKSQKLLPVTLWDDIDSAFEAIEQRLKAVFREIEHQKLNTSISLHQAKPQFNNSWYSFFNQYPPKKKEIPLLFSVNCNRKEHFNNDLRKHFVGNHNANANLVYLISGCPKQRPESLALRLIYFFKDDTFTSFFRQLNNQDEIEIIELSFESSKAKTWLAFLKVFQNRFLPQDIDFDMFIQNPEPVMDKHNRVALTFSIEEILWNDYEVHEHIEYIVQQFSSLPPTCRKFVFFFIFRFPEVHETRRNQCLQFLDLLDTLGLPSPQYLDSPAVMYHQVKFPPQVQQEDVEIWINSVMNSNHVVPTLAAIKKRMSQTKSKTTLDKKLYDMIAVEELQYATYSFVRDM